MRFHYISQRGERSVICQPSAIWMKIMRGIYAGYKIKYNTSFRPWKCRFASASEHPSRTMVHTSNPNKARNNGRMLRPDDKAAPQRRLPFVVAHIEALSAGDEMLAHVPSWQDDDICAAPFRIVSEWRECVHKVRRVIWKGYTSKMMLMPFLEKDVERDQILANWIHTCIRFMLGLKLIEMRNFSQKYFWSLFSRKMNPNIELKSEKRSLIFTLEFTWYYQRRLPVSNIACHWVIYTPLTTTAV